MNHLEELRQALAAASEADRIPIIERLDPTLDRDAWAEVAEHAYLTTNDSLKEAATRYFIRCATQYAQQLSPSFHMVPWDTNHLLEEDDFAAICQRTIELTSGFQNMTPEHVAAVLQQEPRSLMVFRMIVAYSPTQVSFLLSVLYDVDLSKDQLRRLEKTGGSAPRSLRARWEKACPSLGELLFLAARGEVLAPAGEAEVERFRRFRPLTDKVDTRDGWQSVARMVSEALPYSAILYQRYIGSTFGLAINASTSLKADLLEEPVQKLLQENRIPFYRVRTREKVKGWQQAPDFFIPGKEEPRVLIEAKVAEDGGTARDKASRIERLSRAAYDRGATLISVVDGLGFFRINDVLAPILGNSKGLVFSYSNLNQMLQIPALRAFIGNAEA